MFCADLHAVHNFTYSGPLPISMWACHTIIGPPQKRSPRTVHGRIIGPPWDHPWRCKQSPFAVIGPTNCSLAQVTNIHWRVTYEARKRKQTRMESLHRPSGGHVVQVILSGAHNAPERIYKSRMHDSYSYSFSHGLAQSMQRR